MDNMVDGGNIHMKTLSPFLIYIVLFPSIFVAKMPLDYGQSHLKNCTSSADYNQQFNQESFRQFQQSYASVHNLIFNRSPSQSFMKKNQTMSPDILKPVFRATSTQVHMQTEPLESSQKSAYKQQVAMLCTIIEKLINPHDTQPLSTYANDLKQCNDLFEQYPKLKIIILEIIEKQNPWSFLNIFNNIPEENYPTEIREKIQSISKNLSKMNSLEKLRYLRSIIQKMKQ
jgi:hypothetical protein